MTKVELRNKFKEIRYKIANKELKSKEITAKIIENEMYKNSKVVALYASFPYEVDTYELISISLANGKIVALPKIIENDKLKFYRVFSYEELETKGCFGIKEPYDNIDNFKSIKEIDLIIVPGICFDILGNRIGFGKGYYDKYLTNSSIKKIGVCFDEQVIKNTVIPVDAFDVKMDMVITDKEIY